MTAINSKLLSIGTRLFAGLIGITLGTTVLASANTETPRISLTPEMVKLANAEATRVLEYSDNEIAGGLSEELTNVRLEDIVEVSPGVWTARIVSDAFYFSTDFDFGDPVDEVETVCRTDIEVRSNSQGSGSQGLDVRAVKTTCDFNPWDNEGWIQDEP